MPAPAARPRVVIVTDLDGTLLDRDTYSHHAASMALNAVRELGVPVVFCSSKTRTEQIVHRAELDIGDPYIVEDGGAIVLPRGYFDFEVPHQRSTETFDVIELGIPYAFIRKIVETVRVDTGIAIQGYGDMSVDDVGRVTGLDHEAAARAKAREYQETIVSQHSREDVETLRAAFAGHGLRLTRGGRFLAVSGPHDKGVAVKELARSFRRKFGAVRMVGIGDSHNDAAMLAAVDVPVLVQKQSGEWETIPVEGVMRVEGVGPEGWNRFVLDYVKSTTGSAAADESD